MIRTIKDIDFDNISFGSIKKYNNRHIPIKYNGERLLIKVDTLQCIQFNNEQLMVQDDDILELIGELEKLVVININKCGKQWGLNSSYKYISLITNYDYRTVANISIFDIKPMLFDNNKNPISTDMTEFQGSIKCLIEIKDIVINDNTKVIFLYIVIHQIQFIKAEEIFTQITEYAL
jgi:hypothetical protein